MCGIFGVINFDGKPVDQQKLITARDTMFHRGPDDEGIYISQEGNMGFGFRRLAIIDLSPNGHQPMTTPDGRYTIVFNGEIYNYRELSEECRAKNVELKSKSDTEILLYLYVLEGEKCLHKLRGMFAFAIWDDVEKKLFAARDRFGIKPFYYLYNKNEFIFSSELKAIKYYKNKILTNSIKAIDAFLRTGSVPEPMTIYEETFALPAGNYLMIKNNKLEIKRWWNFFDMTAGKDLHKIYNDKAKEEILNSLMDTTKAHLVADVEVGVFLSGGIDSTAILSLMRKAKHENIKTVSIVFPGSKLDESMYSDLAAKEFNTNHYRYPITEEQFFSGLDGFFNSIDQPTVDGINTYFVSKAANDLGLKVVLSGLGGDELFGGYPSFKYIPIIERIKKYYKKSSVNKGAVNLLFNFAGEKIPLKVKDYVRSKNTNNPYFLFRSLFTQGELDELGWKYKCDSIYETEDSLNLFNAVNISYLESTLYMKNQLLRDSDIFSMAHSLELRVPFVDHLLYKSYLPFLQKGNSFLSHKRLFINLVGNIPKPIHNRKKMGFTFPFEEWLRKRRLNKSIKETILNQSNNGLINKNGELKIIQNFENGKVHWSRVWALYTISKTF